ncbi:hypothetical protein KTH81_17705 [Lachnospiraceae bacterium ASD3451]|uniref:hypothetical protein n=1 Tax=Diplocloster agilis TaxID=2850323 RepID=UPI001DD3AAC3|nr:hypothetical protein [Diplocloster agilis]MBU9745661.1 hypothetical protein [Diplocloster agilis]
MLRVVGLLIVCLILLNFAKALAVGLILLAFLVKKKVGRMDRDKWLAYFERVKGKGIFVRGIFLVFVSGCVMAGVAFWAFRLLGVSYPGVLSGVLFGIGVGGILIRGFLHRRMLMEKLERFCCEDEKEKESVYL